MSVALLDAPGPITSTPYPRLAPAAPSPRPCRDLQRCSNEDMTGRQPHQLSLPGLAGAQERPRRVRRRRIASTGSSPPGPDPLVAAYLRRLAALGVARKGLAAYRYQLRAIALTAARLAGRTVPYEELFQSPELLGRALVDDTAPTRGTRLSRWTLAQRRSAIRSFAALMRPELHELLGEEPGAVLDRALRAVAVRVGTGYRLTGGAPRQRGGEVPSGDEIAAVLTVAGAEPGYTGRRNAVFFAILAATGARVNALRQLDGTDCVAMPSGRLRLFLHEKGKAEPREVELSRELGAELRAYVDAFNLQATRSRWRGRVRLGEPGAIWRNTGGRRWSYAAVLTTLHQACLAAGVRTFRPHALRRAFATDAASALPRHIVAQAGGWQGLERLDDHYVHPHARHLWSKLDREATYPPSIVTAPSTADATAIPV